MQERKSRKTFFSKRDPIFQIFFARHLVNGGGRESDFDYTEEKLCLKCIYNSQKIWINEIICFKFQSYTTVDSKKKLSNKVLNDDWRQWSAWNSWIVAAAALGRLKTGNIFQMTCFNRRSAAAWKFDLFWRCSFERERDDGDDCFRHPDRWKSNVLPGRRTRNKSFYCKVKVVITIWRSFSMNFDSEPAQDLLCTRIWTPQFSHNPRGKKSDANLSREAWGDYFPRFIIRFSLFGAVKEWQFVKRFSLPLLPLSLFSRPINYCREDAQNYSSSWQQIVTSSILWVKTAERVPIAAGDEDRTRSKIIAGHSRVKTG